MRFNVLILLLTVILCRLTAQTFPLQGLENNPLNKRAYIHARIIPRTGQVINDGVVWVEEGVIRAMGKDVELPDGIPVTDLHGAYVYPGFIDAVSRYGMPEIPRSDPGPPGPRPLPAAKGPSPWNDAIHSHRDAAALFNPDAKKARALMEQGFTVVQTAQRDGIFQGHSATVLLNDGRANDNILQRGHSQFMSFSKGRSRQDYPTSLMGAIALIRQTLYDARWYRAARRVWQRNPAVVKPEYNMALEALFPLLDKKETLLFTVGNYLDVPRAVRIAEEFSLPVVVRGASDLYRRMDDLKRLNVTVIVPLNFPSWPVLEDAYAMDNISLEALKYRDAAPETPARLARAGIPFALTADGLKKEQSFLKQLRTAVQRGLSPDDALDALTRVPAGLAGVEKQCGTLQPGKMANMVIARGDLFRDDNAVILTVVIAGKEHPIHPEPAFDWRGRWRVTGEGYSFELRITGKADTPKVTLHADSVKLKITQSDFSERGARLMLPADFRGRNVPLPVVLDRFDSTLNGFVRDYAGRRVPLRATRVSPQHKATSRAADKTTPEKALFPVTYPDKAWGRTTPRPEQPEYVLVKNAVLWTVSDKGILKGYDLLIRKGVIRKIGRGISAPAGCVVIDARGKHVTPGLIDEHSHIAISRGVNEAGQAVTAEVRIGDVINPDNINIYRQLAGGVTTSQLLHGSANPIGGQAQVIKLRWGANSEDLKFRAAPPTIKFALGENVKQSNWGNAYHTRYPQTRMGVKELFIDAFERARAYEKARQAYNRLSVRQKKKTLPPRRDLELDALSEILNHQRFIHCHSYVQSEILGLMEAAEQFGFKIATFTHILEGYKVAPEMAAHDAMASTFADWWDYKFEVYEAIPYNSALMTRAGVVTSVNSDDAEMARRLNQEAAKAMTYGGLSPEEAIKLVTINPARQLKVDERVGSLEPGKDADFVIWSGPPLSGYSRVEQTWIEGRRYFDLESDRQLRETMREQRQRLLERALIKQTESKGNTNVKQASEPQDYDCDDQTDYLR